MPQNPEIEDVLSSIRRLLAQDTPSQEPATPSAVSQRPEEIRPPETEGPGERESSLPLSRPSGLPGRVEMAPPFGSVPFGTAARNSGAPDFDDDTEAPFISIDLPEPEPASPIAFRHSLVRRLQLVPPEPEVAAEASGNPEPNLEPVNDQAAAEAEMPVVEQPAIAPLIVDAIPAEFHAAPPATEDAATETVEDMAEPLVSPDEVSSIDLMEEGQGLLSEAEEIPAPPASAPESLFDSPESYSIDREALRELVAEILREELQGALGERMTRNVRKLVRAEIRRALAGSEFD